MIIFILIFHSRVEIFTKKKKNAWVNFSQVEMHRQRHRELKNTQKQLEYLC